MNYDTLPSGYSLYRNIDLNTDKVKTWVQLAAFAALLVMVVPAAIVMPPWRTQAFVPVSWLSVAYLLLFVAISVFGYLLLHELVHGICFRVFGGGKARYGQQLPNYLYAASDRYIAKSSYVLIGLAPLVVLTILFGIACMFVPPSWFWIPYFALASNVAGCAGDVYVCLFVLPRMPKDALVLDSGTAMQIFSREVA
ncbi:MAG: DUF3267 domain-containing protein [Oscillospiraceae bacterium]|nr:DUF3267 domain-containing protein [Oscillospiraceae bacterium]